MAYPILLAELDKKLDPYERAEIIGDLGRSVSFDAESLKRISKELDAEELSVRSTAASVLARNEVDLERSLSILTEAFDDPDDETRWASVVTLGQLGTTAAQTVDRLIQLVRDDETRAVQLAGVWALGAKNARSNLFWMKYHRMPTKKLIVSSMMLWLSLMEGSGRRTNKSKTLLDRVEQKVQSEKRIWLVRIERVANLSRHLRQQSSLVCQARAIAQRSGGCTVPIVQYVMR